MKSISFYLTKRPNTNYVNYKFQWPIWKRTVNFYVLIEILTYNWSVVDFAMQSAWESCCTSARSGRWRISLASSATVGLWSKLSVLLEDEGPGKGNSGNTTIRGRYASLVLNDRSNESWLEMSFKNGSCNYNKLKSEILLPARIFSPLQSVRLD